MKKRKVLFMSKQIIDVPPPESSIEACPSSYRGSSLKGKKLNANWVFSNSKHEKNKVNSL